MTGEHLSPEAALEVAGWRRLLDDATRAGTVAVVRFLLEFAEAHHAGAQYDAADLARALEAWEHSGTPDADMNASAGWIIGHAVGELDTGGDLRMIQAPCAGYLIRFERGSARRQGWLRLAADEYAARDGEVGA